MTDAPAPAPAPAPDTAAGAPAVEAEPLVDLLDLELIDTDLWRGAQPDSPRERVFGGQVAAQALVAAVRSVDDALSVHSLHSYFLLPGDYSVPIVYDVERIRDGRSFATRRVVARQHGRAIYYLTANFHRHEEGFEHQDAMPEVPGPEHGIDMTDLMRRRGDAESAALIKEWAAIDARWLGNSRHGLDPDPAHPSRSRMWVRINQDLGEDRLLHDAAFTYASDISLLGATLAAHPVTPPQVQMASLDHTIWFHRPFRADRWWLYDQWSPSAQGGRGLALSRVFAEDGTLVATVAQEGLIRPRRSS
ncbi:acyl-CoA thioesterase [Nocardioides perillae]|uniref:Acyl-CoA thioesterase 2 n=1 Tax=Nocardioides perillae TaxID=1119534 RepID=A0A7Y9RUR6_9ACTN|nr:acyl-CoA thioesterase II [Nocardioides perillae]NYG55711.1 acyl-CoA thioesterase-2 [Nocardioides perillae]